MLSLYSGVESLPPTGIDSAPVNPQLPICFSTGPTRVFLTHGGSVQRSTHTCNIFWLRDVENHISYTPYPIVVYVTVSHTIHPRYFMRKKNWFSIPRKFVYESIHLK